MKHYFADLKDSQTGIRNWWSSSCNRDHFDRAENQTQVQKCEVYYPILKAKHDIEQNQGKGRQLECRGCEEVNVGGKACVTAWMRKWYTTVTS